MNDSLHILTPGIIEVTSSTVKFTPLTAKVTGDEAKVVDAVGDERFAALPILELPDRNGGGTGYIDFVEPDDMSAPLMRGTDAHGRNFLAVRMAVTTERTNWDTGETAVTTELEVEVLFQRYTTAGSAWTSGGARHICSSRLTDKDAKFLARLVSGGRCGSRSERSVRPDGEETPLPDGAFAIHLHTEMYEGKEVGRYVMFQSGSIKLA
jgi:hypothetical protein